MHFIALGLNHKTAPIDIREKLACAGGELHENLDQLSRYPAVQEGVILSTCNRTEIYVRADTVAGGAQAVLDLFAWRLGAQELERCLYRLLDLEAVRHLFRVAAGLDSMILGEPQILGQVKEAFFSALKHNTVKAHLSKIFRQALEVGKRVRTETEIGENAVSVGFAAVELTRKIFGELRGRSVLVIGAGKMSELVIKNLVAQGVGNIAVANRTFERALEFAGRFGGTPVGFDAVRRWLVSVDIVISSTGAPNVILDQQTVKEVMRARRNRSLFLVDIAVPRDIDPRVHQIDNVYLYNIDDLQAVVEANLHKRELAAEQAEIIVAEEVAKFSHWWSERQVVPLIRALKSRGDEIQRRELKKLFNRLPDLTEKEKNQIAAMTHLIVNKLLHHPLVFAKEVAKGENCEHYIHFLQHLFALEHPEHLENTEAQQNAPSREDLSQC